MALVPPSPAGSAGSAGRFDGPIAANFRLFLWKAHPGDYRLLRVVGAVWAFLGYYFLCESLFARTPEKLLMGLVVRQFAGSNCGLREAAIRTLMRVGEVNPILLGALPAGATILIS